jgi:predicted HTH domain antitoxin
MNLAINIPDNIFFGINETEQSLTLMLKEKLALELYKSHQISLTQGAKMLSIDIYEFMNFISKHGIPVIDDYDIEDEVAIAKLILK